jgi:tryptophanyl-tRNA synthetase
MTIILTIITTINAAYIILFVDHYQYLLYNNNNNNNRLEEILRDYGSGAMLTGEVKKELIAVLQEMVREHQERRASVTREVVEQFMTVRQLEF